MSEDGRDSRESGTAENSARAREGEEADTRSAEKASDDARTKGKTPCATEKKLSTSETKSGECECEC